MKYLPLFHHFKAIYQFPKHIIFWVKIVASLKYILLLLKHVKILSRLTQDNQVGLCHEIADLSCFNVGLIFNQDKRSGQLNYYNKSVLISCLFFILQIL